MHTSIPSQRTRVSCCGILLTFPPGQNEHLSYPFTLHSERTLPWNYQSINSEFFLQVKSCQKKLKKAESACHNCCSIETNVLYQGIVEHMINGIKENTTFTYQPISGLITLLRGKVDQVCAMHLTKLNDSCKLVGKAAALEDHKQWILAVASGKVN